MFDCQVFGMLFLFGQKAKHEHMRALKPSTIQLLIDGTPLYNRIYVKICVKYKIHV